MRFITFRRAADVARLGIERILSQSARFGPTRKMVEVMMNKLGALLFIAVAAQAQPLNAEGVLPATQSQNAQTQTVAAQSRDGAAQDDVTGAINKGAQSRVIVTPVDSSRAAQGSSQGKAPISYEEAFQTWRNCALLHQGVGNPAPQCEPLRLALRQAIGFRPRGYQTVDARSRN